MQLQLKEVRPTAVSHLIDYSLEPNDITSCSRILQPFPLPLHTYHQSLSLAKYT